MEWGREGGEVQQCAPTTPNIIAWDALLGRGHGVPAAGGWRGGGAGG